MSPYPCLFRFTEFLLLFSDYSHLISRAVEWTEQHDLVFLREMVASDIFYYKKGSPDRGRIWEGIQQRLNSVEQPKFVLKDKRAVRDRWNLLQSKFRKRIADEEKASGIDVEMSERDVLIEELCSKEESLASKANRKKADREAADHVRREAMERMKGTAKRKSSESDTKGGGNKSRRNGGELVDFLREKAKSEQEFRQRELEVREREQESAAKRQQDILQLMAQQQMVLMSLMQKLADK